MVWGINNALRRNCPIALLLECWCQPRMYELDRLLYGSYDTHLLILLVLSFFKLVNNVCVDVFIKNVIAIVKLT